MALHSPSLSPGGLLALLAFSVAGSAWIGVFAGLGSSLCNRTRAAAVPWTFASWAALAAFGQIASSDRAGNHGLEIAAALAIGWVVFQLSTFAARRVVSLESIRRWVAVDAVLLAAVLALSAVRVESKHASAATPSADRPNILLVTIDTLRADFVGCYGRKEARTAVLDALASRGYLFEHAVTHTCLTGPSHTTIITGLLPVHHGLSENVQPLKNSVPTIAERIASLGYRTAAFVSGYPLEQSSVGWLSRFETWDDDFREFRALPRESRRLVLGTYLWKALAHFGIASDPHGRSASAATDAALPWIGESSTRPFFAWVHYFDPHLPYEPPDEMLSASARAYRGPATGEWYGLPANTRERIIQDPAALRHMNELYDAEIAEVDRELGRLIEGARARAGSAGLWIVITADHGESFGEHGRFFQRDLYQPSLHVPLIIVPPEGLAKGERIASTVGLVDIAPTLAEISGASLDCDGASLVPLMHGQPWRARAYVSEIMSSTPFPYRRPSFAVSEDSWKLIVREPGWDNSVFLWNSEARRELHDLSRDAAELDDVALREAARSDELEAHAAGLHHEAALAPIDLDDEQLEQLKSLGYAR